MMPWTLAALGLVLTPLVRRRRAATAVGAWLLVCAAWLGLYGLRLPVGAWAPWLPHGVFSAVACGFALAGGRPRPVAPASS